MKMADMTDLQTLLDEAERLFLAGYSCCQSVAAAFYREVGLPQRQLLRLSCGHGGGVSRLREMCGAVSGMTLVISAVLQTDDVAPDGKRIVYPEVRACIDRFEAENGSYLCRDLLGLPAGHRDVPVPSERSTAYYASRPCAALIASAVRITYDWLAARQESPAADAGNADAQPLDEAWYALHAPQRPADGHKSTFGKVLAAVGCEAYRGAAALCCEAALRSGAGLVQLASVSAVNAAVAARLPEVTFLSGEAENDSDHLDDFIQKVLNAVQDPAVTAVVAGCGLGQSDRSRALLEQLLPVLAVPAVLDADALNLLADAALSPLTVRPEGAPMRVLTPHPGELARLTGSTVAAVTADLPTAAAAAAARFNSIVVLKSARTVIAAPDDRRLVLDAPNSGLSKGGSGDVLAGLIAGLLAQGMEPFDAAGCGVWLHSAAARRAASELGEAAMLPSDLLKRL